MNTQTLEEEWLSIRDEAAEIIRSSSNNLLLDEQFNRLKQITARMDKIRDSLGDDILKEIIQKGKP